MTATILTAIIDTPMAYLLAAVSALAAPREPYIRVGVDDGVSEWEGTALGVELVGTEVGVSVGQLLGINLVGGKVGRRVGLIKGPVVGLGVARYVGELVGF
jgi:hypothetical protein